MLKQFNVSTLSFRDPAGEDKEWVNIETQAQIDEISVSITNGGDVWVENGEIRCSGKAPSEFHIFDREKKQFVISKEKQDALFAKRKACWLSSNRNRQLLPARKRSVGVASRP